MTIDEAKRNLDVLLNAPDLKLGFQDHVTLRQSAQLLYEQAKDRQENKEEVK
jgi:hypothetical protein